ncbi:16S rRNA (guanine(966)-N(2))-methyltransferase RsmD [Sphingomonas sp. LY29]|uniref:16S rRNA (guanine(966)-N(2))-methyltransferase RsmD n=1 Tax=Sphingomonas sp. LY29 TaxID=3095341 RepID=UPI002D7690B7|nr:16S rRNA (guanine(966)-N(2))-methyltransferase RsmD [Sphingomonas sp. LY29]WRP26486.1 16S rRNA (guanine(966)-N(2))-methyltransferase RsmD [Sphingomonas sp. LY29]
MRIIAGAWRGRPLVAPKGQDTRPTADRTRETLFSMLISRVGDFEGLRVADLFAGSGALGLEALSRGAAEATFVEQDRAAIKAIETNLEKLGALTRGTIRGGSALALPKSAPFDLILADPPYADGSGTAAATAIAKAQWVAPGGWVAIETERKQVVEAPEGWRLDAERDVGRARITLFQAS